MELSVLSELDVRYRANFFHDEEISRDAEWVSGYSFLSGGSTFTGRAVDLAVSVCEGLITELGFHASDVWLGYGVNHRNEFKYACLARVGSVVYELGRLDQGAYGNSYGRPYTGIKEVEFSDTDYEQLYRFDLQQFITVLDEEWPLGAGYVTMAADEDAVHYDEEELVKVDSEYVAAVRSEKLFIGRTEMFDKVKRFLTQPFVILVVAGLFALCVFMMPEFWDFMLGGSILLVARGFVNVAMLLAGVWVVRNVRALFPDGGTPDEVKDLGGWIYLSVAICVLGANLAL